MCIDLSLISYIEQRQNHFITNLIVILVYFQFFHGVHLMFVMLIVLIFERKTLNIEDIEGMVFLVWRKHSGAVILWLVRMLRYLYWETSKIGYSFLQCIIGETMNRLK